MRSLLLSSLLVKKALVYLSKWLSKFHHYKKVLIFIRFIDHLSWRHGCLASILQFHAHGHRVVLSWRLATFSLAVRVYDRRDRVCVALAVLEITFESLKHPLKSAWLAIFRLLLV